MKQYLDLLRDVYEHGSWKEPAREGMPPTKELFGCMMKFENLDTQFPLLTTKKMYKKGIIHELLWFLKGDTNITYLVNNDVNIWNSDAYKYYVRLCKNFKRNEYMSLETFIEHIKQQADKHIIEYEQPFGSESPYKLGDCGQIYGHQWRRWNGYIDQVNIVINNIKKNPNSRYHVITAWQPSAFLPGIPEYLLDKAALPACHMLMQFNIRENKYLDLSLTQRSSDIVLGVPFNIASYALLCHIVAHQTNLIPGTFTWFGNSVHIYQNQMDAVEQQLQREPLPLCKLHIEAPIYEDVKYYKYDDFIIEGYQSHGTIKAPLSVGV